MPQKRASPMHDCLIWSLLPLCAAGGYIPWTWPIYLLALEDLVDTPWESWRILGKATVGLHYRSYVVKRTE